MGDGTGTNGGADQNAAGRRAEVLGIAGIGLIGGSIAAAAKARGVCHRVIGFGRSAERLEAARRARLIDEAATGYDTAADVDLFVSCLPVDRIGGSIREAARRMRPGSVATDAGSVKGAICSEIGDSPAPGVAFIGSHPLAGSEKQGFEHADADLFVGRTCVITPTGREDTAAVSAVEEFWRALGCHVLRMAPDEHDRVLARTSHLPHLAAAAVAAGMREGEERYAAGGFRDVTRIAGGDPELWAGILLANREAALEAIGEFSERCRAFAAAISAADAGELRRLLGEAKVRRDAFGEVFK